MNNVSTSTAIGVTLFRVPQSKADKKSILNVPVFPMSFMDSLSENYYSPTRLAFGVLTFCFKGIGWCRTGGRFPRQRRLVPPAPAAGSPKTAFYLHKNTLVSKTEIFVF